MLSIYPYTSHGCFPNMPQDLVVNVLSTLLIIAVERKAALGGRTLPKELT